MNKAHGSCQLLSLFKRQSSTVAIWAAIYAVLWGRLLFAEPHSDLIQLQTFSTHSRLSIRMDSSVPVLLKSSPQGMELRITGLGLMDIGNVIQPSSDTRIQGLKTQEVPGGVTISGEWLFPTGDRALVQPRMQVFEFRDQAPSRYIVDFWVGPSPTKTQAAEAKRHAEIQAQTRQVEAQERKEAANAAAHTKSASVRGIASVNSISSDLERFNRFCSEAMNDQNDIFLRFNPMHQQVDLGRWLVGTTPDDGFQYYTPKKQNKEAQYLRLALELYGSHNYALAIRALEFLSRDFPSAPGALSLEGESETKFLKANALLKLGMQEQGQQLMLAVMLDSPKSPVALRSAIYLAKRATEVKSYLGALERYTWLIRHHADSPLAWVFHLGAAESLFELKYTDRAAKEYQWIMDHAPTRIAQAEGASRAGDLYSIRFQYERALAAYAQANRYFPEEMKKFPTFLLNWGEALYQLGQYEEARKIFLDSLETHPGYSAGWRASLRLGEIEARLSQEGLGSSEARKWFYDSVNRFPLSPGATLARVRLLPCGDRGGFNDLAQNRFFDNDLKSFPSNPQKEVITKNFIEFTHLAKIRALVTKERDDESMENKVEIIDFALLELPRAKNPVLKGSLTYFADRYLEKAVSELLKKGKKFEALSLYAAKAPKIPKTPQGSPQYVLQLSRVASDLGFGSLAEQLAKSHSAPKALGSRDFRSSEKNFTEAKALWVLNKDLPTKESVKAFERIQNLLGSVLDESPFVYEKEVILALMSERTEQLNTALSHVAKAQLLKNHIRIIYWLASIELKLDQKSAALDLLKDVEKQLFASLESFSKQTKTSLMDDILGVPVEPTIESALFKQTEILEEQGRWKDASAIYLRAMNHQWGGNQAAYQYARSLLKQGGFAETEKAREVLERIVKEEPAEKSVGKTAGQSNNLPNAKLNEKSENSSNDTRSAFWKKLASETLVNIPRRDKND